MRDKKRNLRNENIIYKHSEDTIEKAKQECRGSITFGYCSLFCLALIIATIVSTVYSFISSHDIYKFTVYIVILIPVIALYIFCTQKIRKHIAIEKEIAEASEEESEFFVINCIKTSAIYRVGTPLGTGNGNVEGFYIMSENGEKYVFICLPHLDFKKYSESTTDLLGTLYVRKYKGTNLLCEIRKSL